MYSFVRNTSISQSHLSCAWREASSSTHWGRGEVLSCQNQLWFMIQVSRLVGAFLLDFHVRIGFFLKAHQKRLALTKKFLRCNSTKLWCVANSRMSKLQGQFGQHLRFFCQLSSALTNSKPSWKADPWGNGGLESPKQEKPSLHYSTIDFCFTQMRSEQKCLI